MQCTDFARVLHSFPKFNTFGESVTIVGATKTTPVSIINEAVNAGLGDIGENRVNELLGKFDEYPNCRLHFIGHLQTNKVKYIIGKVALIQSCDSLKLAETIDKIACTRELIQDVLIEINIGREPQKHGFSPEETFEIVDKIEQLKNVNVKGLMTVLPAPNAQNGTSVSKTRDLCLQMRELYDTIRKQNDNISVLSMGMSSDYRIAVDCGSNMLRIGKLLFGERRNYNNGD